MDIMYFKVKIGKKLSFCHKLKFSNSYNLESCDILNLAEFEFIVCKDIEIRKSEFAAKTHFL